MITTKQEKDRTTIVVSRRLKKTELKFVSDYLTLSAKAPKKLVSKKRIKEIADEIAQSGWAKFKKERGLDLK